MSYESVKLALTPVAWYRNDELTGTEMSDSSGNAEHQTYLNLDDPTEPVLLGQATGVDTVVTSRSVYGQRRLANWAVDAAGPFDSKLTFTWEVLIRQTEDVFSNRTLVARDTNRLSLVGTSPFTAHFNLRIGGTDYSVSSSANLLLLTWYHIIGIRNGATMSLMVNGVVVDSRSDLPAATPIDVTGGDFLAYGSTSGGVNTLQMVGNSEELTFYNYALTETQGRTIYESMINASFMNGYSNVISSAILYSDAEPDPVSAPIRHNWDSSLIERVSFLTGISTARKGYEQANGQRIKPRREIELSLLLKDDHERRMFRAKFNANQHRKWWWPMPEYRDRLSGSFPATTTTFAIDTQYKDYEIGGYAGVRQLNDAGRITQWEETLITGMTTSQLTTAPLVNSYTNPEIYPVRRAFIDPQLSLRGHTDSVEDTTIIARLVAEDEKVAPNRIIPWTPTITYKGFEVFSPLDWQSNDWSELREYNIARELAEIDFDTGSFTVESDAIGPLETFSYRMLLEGLEQHATLLGWFYARAGALHYLWVPTMQRDFEIVTTSGGLTVEGHNYFDNFSSSEFRRDLAFVYYDNTMILRRINSVALTGANEILTLDTAIPTLTNLRSLSYLRFCRLEGDMLEIARATDTKARFAWRFQEVLSSPA